MSNTGTQAPEPQDVPEPQEVPEPQDVSGPQEFPDNAIPARNSAPKNGWTTALRVLAWLNVPLVAFTYYGLAMAALLLLAFEQLGDVTTTPSSALVVLALGLGLVALAGSVWVALSLSTSEKVGPTRRLIALSAFMGSSIIFGLIGIFVYSIFALVLPLLISGVAIQSWRSSYRKVDAGSVRRFAGFTVLFGILFLPVTGAGTFYLNALLPASTAISNEMKESAERSATEAQADMVWRNAQALAAFEAPDFVVDATHIALGAEGAGLDYDSVTGKLTTANGGVWYVCLTGPQEQPCTGIGFPTVNTGENVESLANRVWLEAKALAETKGLDATQIDQALLVDAADNQYVGRDLVAPDFPGIKVVADDDSEWYVCVTGPQEQPCSL
jgi:hypothetical protein